MPRPDGPMTFRELNEWCESPEGRAEAAFHERCMKEPLGLIEKIRRPSFVSASAMDEVSEQDVCAAFARDIFGILQVSMPSRGIPIDRKHLSELPERPAVYWLNAPLDSDFLTWRVVYVGRAKNLRHRWFESDHHRHDEAVEWKCRLDWWEIDRGTEGLMEAALIYHLKPAWNERQ
jgi:hypothetical protein